MATISQNVETLFAQIGSFEANSKDFPTGAFAGNLDGILSAMGMLRNQPEQSAVVDDLLYRKIREAETTQTLLRFTTANILGMFLYAWGATGAAGSLRSYQELVRSRPENATSDGDFIEQVLVPRLLTLRELGGSASLGTHLLMKLADFLQTFRAATTFQPNASRADLERLSLPTVLLGLARRRVASSGRRLSEEPGSLEYGLKRDRFFEWMCAQGRMRGLDVEAYLAEFDLLSPLPWWRRFLNAVGRALAALGAWLMPHFRWLPTGGVFWSGFWILIAVVLIVGVPILWARHYERRLNDLKTATSDLDHRPVEVVPPSGEEAR